VSKSQRLLWWAIYRALMLAAAAIKRYLDGKGDED